MFGRKTQRDKISMEQQAKPTTVLVTLWNYFPNQSWIIDQPIHVDVQHSPEIGEVGRRWQWC